MTSVRKPRRLVAALLMCLCVLTACCAAAAEGSLPVVDITAPSLKNWKDKKDVRKAELTYTDTATGECFTRRITIRPQGTSSLKYEKKNFTIVMQEEGAVMQAAWGEQTEYCLKANYIDPTHACNVVSARLAGQMSEALGLFGGLPNHGAVDGFPVWVRLNGRDEGLYTWNIPKAPWMFGMDEENPDHMVLCGESWNDGCLFKSTDYRVDTDWSFEVGEKSAYTLEKFDRLVDFVVNATDEAFVSDFDQYLNRDACLNYVCFAAIANAKDNLGKNVLLATWDGEIWYPMLYDLDSLWGVNWDGESRISIRDTLYNLTERNRLFARIWTLLRPQVNERYALLRSGVLSDENIWAEFERFAEGIPAEAYEWDQQRWNPRGERIRTYEVMREQMAQYLPEIDAMMGYQAP